MTPEQYRRLRKERGTQVEVAALLGVMQSTVSDRETGRREITREAELALRSLPKTKRVPRTGNVESSHGDRTKTFHKE